MACQISKSLEMKLATYDEGWKHALALSTAKTATKAAKTDKERRRWEREARRLGNRITPPAKQAAAECLSEILNAALDWIRNHDGDFNCSAFARHCEDHGIGQRQYSCGGRHIPADYDKIRRVVRSTWDIAGKAGRPPKA